MAKQAPIPSRFSAAPRLAGLSLVLLCLAGCLFDGGERVAGGGEDFPNTAEPLGFTLSNNLSQHTEWNQFSDIPAVSISDADSLVVPPQAKPMAAGAAAPAPKMAQAAASAAEGAASATADSVTWDYSDTADGILRRYTRNDGGLKIRTDTTVIRWDDEARNGIDGKELILESRGAEDWKLSQKLNAYRYLNLDSSGGFDRAAFYERTPKAGGVLLHKLSVVLPGPDGDFAAKGDNLPAYYASARTRGGDTLDVFEVSDADGDGLLWGANDSGLVDVRQKQTEPPLRPSVSVAVQKLRAVFFRQANKTYPVSYSESRTDKDGKKVTYSIKGSRPDSAFGPGDTVLIAVHTALPQDGDSRLSEKTSRFRVHLSGTPGKFGDNELIRFTMETVWRDGAWKKGAVKATSLTFTPDEPIKAGVLTLAGDLEVDAEFADGTSGSAVGRFQDDRIEVEFTDKDGNGVTRKFRIRWSAQGVVLLKEKLPL